MVAYTVLDPIFKKLFGLDSLPKSDIVMVSGAIIFFIVMITIVILEKPRSIRGQLGHLTQGLIVFALALILSIYLSIVVWLQLGLPY